MIESPMDVLAQFPVRKSRKQKQAFRDSITEYAQQLGYAVNVEKGSFGARNIVIGDTEKAKYLITAHYDTPVVLPVPNFITPCNFWAYCGYQILLVIGFILIAGILGGVAGVLFPDVVINLSAIIYWGMLLMLWFGPANKHNSNDNTSGIVAVLQTAKNLPVEQRENVCFVLFDLEEAGLVGSSSYRSSHKKETNKQIVLNLDCVADGDYLTLFPTRKLKKDVGKMSWLKCACKEYGNKSVSIRESGFSYYPSDQCNFPYGVGFSAFHKGKYVGLYLDRIHTKRDTILEEENIRIYTETLIHLTEKCV